MSSSGFIGRQKELVLLQLALADARAGRSRALAILGEAGIGKTRLIRETIRAARQAGFREVVVGHCLPANEAPSLKWLRLKPFEKFAAMIERHGEGIATYRQPENKVVPGFVEGLNNKVRVIQRRADGLRDDSCSRSEARKKSLNTCPNEHCSVGTNAEISMKAFRLAPGITVRCNALVLADAKAHFSSPGPGSVSERPLAQFHGGPISSLVA